MAMFLYDKVNCNNANVVEFHDEKYEAHTFPLLRS